jgi:hypothetical protein
VAPAATETVVRRAIALFLFLVACQAAILTVGALALRVSVSTDVGIVDLFLVLITGVQLPLLLFMLQRGRRRVVSAAFAVCFALLVNVSFVATSTPAAAVTDNSGVFTFQAAPPAALFVGGYQNMTQNYTPSSATATTCPTIAGSNWGCSFVSDSFSTGQSIANGTTAQANLYLENTVNKVSYVGSTNTFIQNAASVALNKPSGLHTGDVMIATFGVRGGTGTTVTAPDATWTSLARVDNGTTVSIVTFWHAVTNAGGEPASYTFTFNGSVKGGSALSVFGGVDNANPIDQETGQSTPSGTSHTALSVTTGAANEMLVTMHAVAGFSGSIGNGWTPPAGMAELVDTGSNQGSAGTNAQLEVNDLFEATAGTATGAQTATSVASAVGATKTITLKPPSTARTCTVTATVKWQNPIHLRSSTTATVESGTSITLNKPAGTAQNDVLVLWIGYTGGGTLTPPTGFSLLQFSGGFGSPAPGIGAWYKVAGSSEPATYTWTDSTTTPLVGWLGAYIGVDPAAPFDVAKTSNESGATTSHPTNSAMSTANTDELLVMGFAVAANATWTPPSGTGEEVQIKNTTGTIISIDVADAIQSRAGASAVYTATSSTSNSGAELIGALKPLAANTTTLGSATVSVSTPGGPALYTTPAFTLSGVTFATGDHLVLDVSVPDDPNNCPATRLSYDGTGAESNVTIATTVPEGVAGLLLLAPALPLPWCRRRRR